MTTASIPASSRPEDTMFFIVGRGRSGSTLLVRMLDAHPQIAVAEEALFVMNLARRYRSGPWTERRIRRLSRDLWREERMLRWGLDRGALEERLLALPPPVTLPRLCAEVYAARAAARGKNGARLLGDKNPHYALFAGELAQLFPRARFVYLLRDYRDNILSYREVRFDLSSVCGLAYRWRRYNEAILEAERAHPERFMRVHFEDLVAAPEGELRRMCRFLGVEYDDAMLAPDRPSRQELPWHRNASGAPDPALVRKWRAAGAPDLRRADAVCQPLAAELGYAASASGARWPLFACPGVVWGWLVTSAERLLFHLPLPLRAWLIRGYRRSTGNVITRSAAD